MTTPLNSVTFLSHFIAMQKAKNMQTHILHFYAMQNLVFLIKKINSGKLMQFLMCSHKIF